MTYEEAITATVSFTEARLEIEAHGCTIQDFMEDTGQPDAATEFEGADVLAWLGY